MKIITRGVTPAEKFYDGRCDTCGSTLEAKRDELQFHADQRDGDYITGKCPVCGASVYFTERQRIRFDDARAFYAK